MDAAVVAVGRSRGGIRGRLGRRAWARTLSEADGGQQPPGCPPLAVAGNGLFPATVEQKRRARRPSGGRQVDRAVRGQSRSRQR